MDVLSAEVGANITILKKWRSMAAELNTNLGRPRLADPKMVLRLRAGCVAVRTILVPKTYIEKRAAVDSKDAIPIMHTVQCREVQVLLVSSMTFPNFWVLPSGGQRIPRAQVTLLLCCLCAPAPFRPASLHGMRAFLQGLLQQAFFWRAACNGLCQFTDGQPCSDSRMFRLQDPIVVKAGLGDGQGRDFGRAMRH